MFAEHYLTLMPLLAIPFSAPLEKPVMEILHAAEEIPSSAVLHGTMLPVTVKWHVLLVLTRTVLKTPSALDTPHAVIPTRTTVVWTSTMLPQPVSSHVLRVAVLSVRRVWRVTQTLHAIPTIEEPTLQSPQVHQHPRLQYPRLQYPMLQYPRLLRQLQSNFLP